MVGFKRYRNLLLRYIMLPVLTLSFCAIFNQHAEAVDTGYEISSYNTEIAIDDENVYHVSENILVSFKEPRHGIFRYIPYRQEMIWNINGTEKRVVYNTKVSSVNVNEPFTKYEENGYLILKIGDPNRTISGSKTYNMSYNHNLGNDKIETEDFVYYNLVGTNWDCNIDKVSFKITLPKEFDKNKISFFSGSYSSTQKAPVQYTVENNTISGTLNTRLLPGEGLTLQLDLPEGYFDVPAPFPWNTFIIVSSIILALLSLILFLLYGRDQTLVKSVEFYPPDGITSAEAGYIIDTDTDDNDVVSLIIYWASKGFLSIDQKSMDDFNLTKLKDMTEEQADYERYMFGQLFYDRDSVSVYELRESFYTTIDTVKDTIPRIYSTNNKRLYEEKSVVLKKLVFFFSALLIFSSTFYVVNEEFYSFLTALISSLAGTIIIMLPFINIGRTLLRWNSLDTSRRISSLVLNIIFAFLVLLAYIGLMYSLDYLAIGVIVAVSAALINAMSLLMRKRTRYGNEMLGKLLGFKNFLVVSEKSRLQRLVQDNPSYFYDVMPFAYVMGVSDKWAKKFEGITMRPPEWFNSYDNTVLFTPLVFQIMLFQSLAAMQENMISRPLPQSNNFGGFGGGGLGGGGFSGGGFGGGGGGSW